MVKRAKTPRPRDLILLGKRLKSWRKAKGWTQEKLAWAAGLDYSHYNEIENGKLNPGALTLFTLARTLELSPAMFFLPLAEAKALQATKAHQTDVLEQSLGTFLDLPELVSLHCDFVELILQAGYFQQAYVWLKALSEIHPQHWQVSYTWARYYVLKTQIPAKIIDLKIASPAQPYQTATSENTELQLALQALEKSLRQSVPDNLSREKALADSDLKLLQIHFPERWQQLF